MHGTVSTAAAIQTPGDIVQLHQFYPDAKRNLSIPRSPDLFLPDQWTEVFARGLLTRDFSDATVLEVGVGTGINMAGLLEINNRAARYIGTDICNNAVTASRILAQDNGWDAQLIASDLLKDVPDALLQQVNHIVACIPQVPTDRNLEEGDNFAHYYKGHNSYWDQYGLGLNSDLLKQAWERVPHASVSLNLSGRPGIDKLRELFDHNQRKAQILHEEMVPQHQGTSIESLAAMEENGHEPFEFFADEDGNTPICAIEAESRRVHHEPVFHKVYVLSANPS